MVLNEWLNDLLVVYKSEIKIREYVYLLKGQNINDIDLFYASCFVPICSQPNLDVEFNTRSLLTNYVRYQLIIESPVRKIRNTNKCDDRYKECILTCICLNPQQNKTWQ